jgi:hypothetical protein
MMVTQISIQIRILKQVLALNSRMISNTTLTPVGVPPPAYTIPEDNEALGATTPTSPHAQYFPSNPGEIHARLHAFRQKENERDAGLDLVDLRQRMRAALQTNDDVQMIEVLQVAREEMPEAIKTLQRALEKKVEKQTASVSPGSSRGITAESKLGTAGTSGLIAQEDVEMERRKGSITAVGTREASRLEKLKTISSGENEAAKSSFTSGSRSGRWVRDTLDREFIESEIDALRRVNNGPDMSLPSWTITK